MVRTLKELHPAKYCVSFVYDDDKSCVRMPTDTRWLAFYKAAERAAMDDIYEISKIRVHHAGRTYRYVGWQPGMLVEFVNELGVTIFSAHFPQWDH